MQLSFPPDVLRPVGTEQAERAHELAAKSPRDRAIVRYHAHSDLLQRMLNALRRDTYVPVHRHVDPDKVEVFLALEGHCAVCRFDDAGALIEVAHISPEGPLRGVEIPPGTWHTVVCLSERALLYEIIEGPYTVTNHKRQAPFSPDEGSEAALEWMTALRAQVSAFDGPPSQQGQSAGAGPDQHR
jgi:cupin fold WbuC family metalloprotein